MEELKSINFEDDYQMDYNQKTEFEIYEGNFELLQKKIEKLNRKALKLNCKPLQLNILSEEFITEGEEVFKVYNISVEGETPIIKDWQFIGIIEHLDGQNLIKGSDENIPSYFKTIDKKCDHCNINRYRKDTYIIRNIITGEYKQIGKSCLKDFLGFPSINQYLFLLEIFNSDVLTNDININTAKKISYFPTSEILKISAYIVRNHTYISRDNSREKIPASIDRLYDILDNKKEREKINSLISIDDKTTVNNAMKYIKSLTERDLENNYLYNIKVLSEQKYITSKNLGLLMSIIPAYNNHINKLRKLEESQKEKSMSDFVGSVGERKKFDLIYNKSFSFESQFGITYIHKFKDIAGNIFIWKTSKGINSTIEKDQNIEITGTIKEYKIYNNEKQTIITRCKI